MKQDEFIKEYNAYFGEDLRSIETLKKHCFDGEELMDFINHLLSVQSEVSHNTWYCLKQQVSDNSVCCPTQCEECLTRAKSLLTPKQEESKYCLKQGEYCDTVFKNCDECKKNNIKL